MDNLKLKHKRLSDFKDEELATLTSDQIEEVISIECMCNGICKPSYEPEFIEKPKIPLPDIEAYRFDFVVDSKSSRDKVIELFSNESVVPYKLDCEYSVGFDHKYLKEISLTSMYSMAAAYSEERYNSIKPSIAAHKTAEEHNESIINKYREMSEGYENIREEVLTRYYDACDSLSNVYTAVRLFKEYVSLSNGDEDVAKNFFMKSAYADYYDKMIEKYRETENYIVWSK